VTVNKPRLILAVWEGCRTHPHSHLHSTTHIHIVQSTHTSATFLNTTTMCKSNLVTSHIMMTAYLWQFLCKSFRWWPTGIRIHPLDMWLQTNCKQVCKYDYLTVIPKARWNGSICCTWNTTTAKDFQQTHTQEVLILPSY